MSPSSRGRGLKSLRSVSVFLFHWSPSSRGRGLKCSLYDTSELVDEVALFTRAWIEIEYVTNCDLRHSWSPSSRGRGLKLIMTGAQ